MFAVLTNKTTFIMNIKAQYIEFRKNLIKEIREMVKALYLKTYGEEPNFEDDETYYLDLSDIPYKRNRMRICRVSVDVFDGCEKQKIEYIIIDNDGKMDFETEVNTLPATTINTDELMVIYDFFSKVLEELEVSTEKIYT